ncbi:MAG: DUF4388 domain-containing protein [Myxococcota bacterium]|nr:DUF4388 domain-containing protein [Myxococcota bacterium]
MQRPPIGELFVQLKLLTPDEVASVLKRMQKSDTGRFGATALELNLVDHEGLARALAQQFGLRYVTGERIQRLVISAETLELVPTDLMREHLIVPTFMDGESRVLSVLTADPTNLPSLRAVQEQASAQRLRLFIGPEPAVAQLIERLDVDAAHEPDASESDDTEQLPIPIPSFEQQRTLVLETNLERLAALRTLQEHEGDNTEFVHDPEQVAALLQQGGYDVLVHRRELAAMVEAYLPSWRRISPGLTVSGLDGYGPGHSSGGIHAAGCDFLLNLLEFILLASETKNMDARARVRRTTRFAKQVAQELRLPQEQRDAIVVAALVGEMDQLNLVRGIVADDNEAGLAESRFELSRALVNPFDPPYDLDGIFRFMEAKRAGQEISKDHFAGDVLFSVRAVVEKGKPAESDPERILGSAISQHNPAVLQAVQQVLKREVLRGQLTTAGTLNELSTPTIVIAEREAALVTALEVRLGQAGYETVVVADGEAALRETHALHPVAVIANMRLPRRDGLALVMELKHSKDTATIPVVLITNRKSAADVNRGLEIGAEEVLEKPINVQLLLTRLRKVIAQSGKQVKGASLTGMLAELSFAELLQTLHLSGKTARVEVRSGLQKGSVCLVDGKVLSADLGEATGEAAFYELVALQHGRFEVQIGQRPETTNLTESTEFLLLEALRRLDERRRA